MKKVSVAHILSFLEVAMQCVIFISVTSMAYFSAVGRDESEILSCFVVVIPVIIAYLCRKYISKFNLFVLCHILMVIIFMMFSKNENEAFFNFIIMVFLTIFSIRLKNVSVELHSGMNVPIDDRARTPDERKTPLASMIKGERISVAFLAVMVIGCCVGTSTGKNIIVNIEIILSVIFVVLQILYNNMYKIYDLFNLNYNKSDFPAQQVKSVNIFLTAAAIFMILFGMLIFYNGEYGTIFDIIGRILKKSGYLLGKLLIFLLGIFGKDSDPNVVVSEEAESETASTIAVEELEEGSAIMEALAEAFGALIIVAMIIGVIYLLRNYIRNFNKAKRRGNDYIEYIKPEYDAEKLSKKSKKIKVKVSKEERDVRKMYKQKVLRGSGEKLPNACDVPTKLTLDNITDDEQKAEKITEVYEKARYSNEQITDKDIHIMKNLP